MKAKVLLVMAMMALIATAAHSQLLWRVTDSNTGKTSYVFGTHHFAPLSMLESIKGLDAALRNADKVYGELDMQAAMDPSALMGMQQMMMAPADSTIDKVLTAKQLADLNMAWAKYGTDQIPLNALYVLKPAGLSTQLAALMSAKVLPDINVGQGIDNELQVRARKAGKPGWHSIIPILSMYQEYALGWKGWVGLLFLLCAAGMSASYMLLGQTNASALLMLALGLVSFVLHVIESFRLAKAFGKGGGTGILLVLLRNISRFFLGVGKAKYIREE